MALNLNPGHAYADVVLGSGSTSYMFRFRTGDVATRRFVFGPTKSTSYGRVQGLEIDSGNLSYQRDTGSESVIVVQAIEPDTWYQVIVSGNIIYVDSAAGVTGSNNGDSSGLDRIGFGIKYDLAATEYGDPDDLSIVDAWLWTDLLSEAQRTALFAGDDPATVNAANLLYGWPLIDNGDDVVGAADITNTSGTVTFDSADGSNTPSPSISGTALQPGEEFTLTYGAFAAIPISPVTLTDSNGNTLTVPVTINDAVAGDDTHEGTAVGTMPALPSSGSQAGLLLGDVTARLTT